MRLQELIARLQREAEQHGDVEVLLHVTNHTNKGRTEVECIGDVTSITYEQEHGDNEGWFVRISGDDEE